MVSRFLVWFVVIAAACFGEIPTPEEHLGFPPGEDYKLADYSQIVSYFQKLDEASDRLRFVEFGRSAHGKPMYAAFISSVANLQNLEKYREINRKLALGLVSQEESRRLANEGKAIVWIDSGLHSSEVAPAQHAPVLAHRLLTDEGEEARRIRESVILIQVPVINPDGHDWIVEWYRKNVGTPYEIAPLPKLYQKYAGHDNNRDWFMMNLQETRQVAPLLYEHWFPHIVYNQHQQPAFPARIFVPPYAEPLNPNVPASVMEGVNLIGAAMKERFAREDKPGVLSYFGFDAWWNGGMRTAPAFHNMHGILTETAAGVYATPRIDDQKDLPKAFANGTPAQQPSIFYQRPWLGGRWGVKEAIDYMITADFAILDLAATRPHVFLQKAYDMARASITAGEEGTPYAYVVPAGQWDTSSALAMLRRLRWAGITVHRAASGFSAGEKEYSSGAYVLLAAQPFRAYLVDLMEPQQYPEIRQGPDGSVKRPYDITGWTLSMNMGVSVDRIDDPFQADLEEVAELPGTAASRDHRENASFRDTALDLRRGERVRWGANGEILYKSSADKDAFSTGQFELRPPRLALYESWVANIDTGWTQWVLDEFEVPYTLIHNDDFQGSRLSDRFDTVLLASQNPWTIVHGYREAEAARRANKPELDNKARQRPEFTGGIGLLGLHNLERFVVGGGTLIAIDDATRLPVEMFPLPVQDVSGSDSGGERFSCPGSLIRLTVEGGNPIAFGMPPEMIGFSRGGKAFEIRLVDGLNEGEREARVVVRYAKSSLLASGWLSGEKSVLGKPAVVEIRHGKGKVILFGFRPQFRGQTYGAFKLLLNAVYLASAKELE